MMPYGKNWTILFKTVPGLMLTAEKAAYPLRVLTLAAVRPNRYISTAQLDGISACTLLRG